MQLYFLQEPSLSYTIIIACSKKTSLLIRVLDMMFERA